MTTPLTIEVYGYADGEICAGCEGHGCATCAPGEKKRTIDLFQEFSALFAESEHAGTTKIAFYEATPENIARNQDVQRLLSMADLAPVIVLDGKIAYIGGFSPAGLLDELRKQTK